MEEKLFDTFEKVSRQQWQEKIVTDLKGKDYQGLLWEAAGLSGEPIFTKEDLPTDLCNLANIHPQPDLFGDRHWVNYQWIPVEEVKKANQTALRALNQGADGVIFVLNHVPDWPALLKDIALNYCHLGLVDNSHGGSGCMPSFMEYGEANSIDPSELQGFFLSNDAQLVIHPNKSNFNHLHLQVSDEFTGGLPVIELACQLAQAAEFFDQLTNAGFTPSSLFSQTQFELSIGDSYFVELAKFRAMRGLALKFASAYGVDLGAGEVQIMAMSSDWSGELDDPHSHMLHATTQAMSAIMGGADALCIKPFYPVFDNKGLAERSARNISNILREESYLAKVVDPAAGTYFIESLTQRLSEQAWKLFLAIEEAGGINALDAVTVKSLHQKTNA